MIREVQVHFENGGQVAWNQEIEDPAKFLKDIQKQKQIVALDKETSRHFLLNLKTLTAIIISAKTVRQDDVFDRMYAAPSDIKATYELPLAASESAWSPT